MYNQKINKKNIFVNMCEKVKVYKNYETWRVIFIEY